MKSIPYIIIAVLLCLLFRQCSEVKVRTERYIDTVIIRDTIRDTLLIPQKVFITRVDTVFLQSAADTIFHEVTIPIQQKEYRTDDYFAVIEGYRPSLIRMEVFPETHYITKTTVQTIKKKPRLGIGVQAGYGYSHNGLSPYVGVGLQYNIFTF